jgi:NAD(P)H-nitrite reductase large subunit
VEVPREAILQRDGKTYAFVVRLPAAGLLTPLILRRLADAAEKYAIPAIKLSSAHRLVLAGVKPEDIPAIQQDLGTEVAPALGPCVHYVKACPGTTLCRLGQQDSLALAARLDEMFIGKLDLPHKFKFGISGCPMNCSDSYTLDFGAFGKARGWTVVVGGKGGARPRLGQVLAENLSSDEVVDLAGRVIAAYRALGSGRERLARTIERVGFERFRAAVLEPGEEGGT